MHFIIKKRLKKNSYRLHRSFIKLEKKRIEWMIFFLFIAHTGEKINRYIGMIRFVASRNNL